MHNHPEPLDLLAAYVDSALDAATQATVAAHVADCTSCQADIAAQQAVKRLLAPATAPLTVPGGLAGRVRGQVYGSVLRPVATRPRLALPRLPNLRGWFAMPALAALLLLLMVSMSVAQVGPFAPSPVAAALAMSIQDHLMCEHLDQIPHGIPGDMPAVSAKLSALLGMPVAMPAHVPSGYQFKGGHEVDLGTVNSGHLMWMAGPTMLSLYQAHDPGGDPPSGWRSTTHNSRTYWLGPAGAEQALFWRADGRLFLLAGTLSQADLLDLATSVHP